jgi:hypothetical protein
MQFVRKGPDVPERLLQAHEDGRVVFFCGAGISYPAHLPGFAGLTTKLYAEVGETPNAIQQAAIKSGQFDTAIGLLESEIAGGRETVRRALVRILTPNLAAPGATATHEALLTLGTNRKGQTRLVTTNFDRLFEEVITARRPSVNRFRAPLLRAPKALWDGLVYLHGLITPSPTPADLNCLVVSSGDFGLAYLTERWAARFVSELFRNFTVCFVGYSINDPVLRYMMDALAADRLLGESPPEMFAFGSYSKGKEDERANEWKAKNVTPILYREHGRHTYLHGTLSAWAATYRDGVNGNERIVTQWAMARPLTSTKEDDFVGRMLWALTDPQGLPAKKFADLDPVPSLDWLHALCEERFGYEDLARFRVPRDLAKDEKLKFSLTRRPTHYARTPRMELVSSGSFGTDWDEVMFQLARWLTRHLDDPEFFLWLAKRGGKLHRQLAILIDQRLSHIADLESAARAAELETIRAGAPNAIPRPAMRVLWKFMLSGRVQSGTISTNVFEWVTRFKRDGSTSAMRFELRELLTPRVRIQEPFRISPNDGDRPKDLVNCEIVLSSDYVHDALKELRENEDWKRSLPELAEDVSLLLRDAMDCMRAYGGADDRSDFSYINHPSIEEHSQNRHFQDWTTLVDLARDSWLETAAIAPNRARFFAERWWESPYPIFKRLSFFAAAQEAIVPSDASLGWLLSDQRWWLWSVETEHEAIRLIVALCSKATAHELNRLVVGILEGPPRAMFRDDIEPDRWTRLVEREIWMRLAKLRAAGGLQEGPGDVRLAELAAAHPDWQLEADDRDEFPHWMGDVDDLRSFVPAPRDRTELIAWLREHPERGDWQGDDWRQLCRDNFTVTARALLTLSREGVWPADRWRDAFQAWSEESLVKISWRHIAPAFMRATDEFLLEVAHGVSWWLKSVAPNFEGHEDTFLSICRRVLGLDHAINPNRNDPVGTAINHPVGHVVDALLKFWYRQSLSDNQGLPDALKEVFTQLCDTEREHFIYGRVLLAAHTLSLFRVDPSWSKEHLLPLFDWNRSVNEARNAWEGFLWSPRLYRPLMEALKRAFLESARHYDSLGDHDSQYASLLTYAALDPGETFSAPQLSSATRALPAKGLAVVAEALRSAQEGAGDQRADHWINRVQPFLQNIWPKARERITPAIAESFARLAIETREAFPSALAVVKPSLTALEHPDYTVHKLADAGHCAQFPVEALDLLAIIIGDETPWAPRELQACLTALVTARRELAQDQRFQRLQAFARRREP